MQHTSWTNAERAIERLREAQLLDPRRLAELPDEAIEELIRPSGQYRTKARKLRAFLDLIARHGSLEALLALPPESLRERLLATWGIGEETADAIALYAARRPAVVVDAYTRRLFSRLGLGPSPDDSYGAWQTVPRRRASGGGARAGALSRAGRAARETALPRAAAPLRGVRAGAAMPGRPRRAPTPLRAARVRSHDASRDHRAAQGGEDDRVQRGCAGAGAGGRLRRREQAEHPLRARARPARRPVVRDLPPKAQHLRHRRVRRLPRGGRELRRGAGAGRSVPERSGGGRCAHPRRARLRGRRRPSP